MAVIVDRKPYSNVPEGAVLITKREALEMQWKLIYEWKPKSDVWPFRYGIGALSVGTTMSAMAITNHFRRKLKLFHYGRVVMYMPTILIPSVLLPLIHMRFVTQEVLLQSSCPVCIQVRAVAAQSIAGIAYPMLMSPIAGFMFSTIHATYKLPLFKRENLKELFGIWQKLSRPLSQKLVVMWLLHVVLAVTITNLEAHSFFKVHKKISERYKNEDII